MPRNDMTFMIGGEAGQGVESGGAGRGGPATSRWQSGWHS